MMPWVVSNACAIELASVEGLEDTPLPLKMGTAAPFVLVGLGVMTFVGAGVGVFVGNGVAVGCGVAVGRGVAVSSGVSVGGIDVFVGTGVAVGGTGVTVGGSIGTAVGAGVGVPHPANKAMTTISIRKRRTPVSMVLL